ncbi:hypothetical protein [Brevibacillus formosus]|uniref:hypothetical protein n=1 Tax=Brevibacillus formosus TaxID=54913 RepID=UPI003F1CA217
MTNDENKFELELIKKEGTLFTYRNPLTNEVVEAVSDYFPQGVDGVKYYQVNIVWKQDVSLVKQLAILKRIYPPLGKVTNAQLLNKLKNTKEWVLDGLLAEEAEVLVTKAKENGIEIKLKK